MTIRYIPFESRTGFKSPGFEVTPVGDIVAKSINVVEDIDVTSIKINGIDILNTVDSSISLGDDIVNSSLTRVGTLEYLNIEGDVNISQGSSGIVSIVNGKIIITSGPETGEIDNINIGQTTPALGTFTDITVNDTVTVGGQLDANDNVNVSGTLSVTGTADFSDIEITNQPTLPSHATRKDYVDAKISAFSIAFGA